MSKSVKDLPGYQTYSSLITKSIYAGSKVIRRSFLQGKKILAGFLGTTISDNQFQKALRSEFARRDDFLESFREYKSRRFFIEPQTKEEHIRTLLALLPGAKARIVRAADAICEHTFDLLGSGPTDLGWPIDWHADFKTGHRWDPKQYYADIRPARYPGGYDLKVPWELSRCQHFAWLGQAYWLTGDEKYTREFRSEVEDWIWQNKPEYGVNWACSMDIAIRAVNWLWGYAFFRSSPLLDDGFRLAFYKSLLCHGRHIRANLEWTATFTGNHYLADIVGLVYLGILLPELKEAQGWKDFGLKELEREMFKQVYPDGGNFEASTSYHRLATELFLSTTLLARLNGHNFGEAYLNRLEKMLDFLFQITKPDGTVPIVGDQDNGRLHRMKAWEDPDQEWKDFRGLLALGSILFDKPEWDEAAGDPWEEAIWFYEARALAALRTSAHRSPSRMQSMEFRSTGIYILRAQDIYVAVDAGTIGQNGKGGHAHNDALSFELFSDGQTWIQDPGTYVYTADYEARNLFRSTAFHNTFSMPGYEQNSFDALTLFSLKNESVAQVLSWQVKSDSEASLIGELRRLRAPNIIHRRSFDLCGEHRALLITDTVHAPAAMCELLFHFAPGLEPVLVQEPYPGIKLQNAEGKTAWLFSVSPARARPGLSRGWISESYGKRTPAWVASFQWSSAAEHKTVLLLPGNAATKQRIASVIQHHEDHVH